MDTNVIIKDYDVLKETLYVLSYFDNSFLEKIPDSFLNALKELALKSNKEVYIDYSKSLKEQNISDDCKDLISLIYYNYIASQDEKKELMNIWKSNENIYQKDLHEKYNPENIFKTEIKQNQEKITSENFPMVQEKEKNVIQRIMDFIKGIFK